jgi:hypothetical protein
VLVHEHAAEARHRNRAARGLDGLLLSLRHRRAPSRG